MPFSLVPFVLLILPLVEIAGFVIVGRQIGVFPTLALVVITAVIGSILLRIQGFGLLNRIRADIDAGRTPTRELVHGVMILIAGILLLMPGFVTDILGFALFIPAVRDAIWAFASRRMVVVNVGGAPGTNQTRPSRDGGTTIDLDSDDFTREPDPNTPWGEDRDQDGKHRR